MTVGKSRARNPSDCFAVCPERTGPMAATVREWFLDWQPDLSESIKWDMLCFIGNRNVCGLRACKEFLAICFFRADEFPDPTGLLESSEGSKGVVKTARVRDLADLDRVGLRRLLAAAVELDEEPSLPAPPRVRRPPPVISPELDAALARSPRAAAGFAALPPSCQREYIAWIDNAKRPETRERRLERLLLAVTEGRRWADRMSAASGAKG